MNGANKMSLEDWFALIEYVKKNLEKRENSGEGYNVKEFQSL